MNAIIDQQLQDNPPHGAQIDTHEDGHRIPPLRTSEGLAILNAKRLERVKRRVQAGEISGYLILTNGFVVELPNGTGHYASAHPMPAADPGMEKTPPFFIYLMFLWVALFGCMFGAMLATGPHL